MKQLGIFGKSMHSSSDISVDIGAYWKLYVDGASRNNPGPSGAGIYILKNDYVVEEIGYFLGNKTNNQAEYLALLIGLVYVRQHMQPNDLLLIISDSQLLIRQLQGMYKVRHDNLKVLHAAARSLLHTLRHDVMHVMREENSNADALANKGIDKRIAAPTAITAVLAQHGVVL